MIIEFDEMQIWDRLTKPCQQNTLDGVQIFLHSQNVTCQRRAISNRTARHYTFFSSLFNYFLPWKSYHLAIFNIVFVLPCFFFKVHMVVFADVTEDFYLCRKKGLFETLPSRAKSIRKNGITVGRTRCNFFAKVVNTACHDKLYYWK